MGRALAFFFATTLTLVFLMTCATMTAIITVSILAHQEPPFPQWVVWLVAALTAGSLTMAVANLKRSWS